MRFTVIQQIVVIWERRELVVVALADLVNLKDLKYNALKNNKHPRTELQEDWNRYGEEDFEFEVIEIMEMHVWDDDCILSQREAWWIENLPNLYNKFHRNHIRYLSGHS